MEQFLAEHSLYVVLLVVLTIWLGIALFLYALERKLAMLERVQKARERSSDAQAR